MTDDGSHPAAPRERLLAALQHVTPQRLLTALMHRATRVRWRAWKDVQIRWFMRRYDVDLSDARFAEATAYEHFNAFFTRALRAGARPLEARAHALLSPADGCVNAIGDVRDGELLQAKGRRYRLETLLGGDSERAALFERGAFASIYLAPRDYHRVHMPLDGRLREMTYVPGRLFSVNFATARAVDGLFARNERLVCLFDGAHGPMAVILVGAMIVAGLETVWSGAVTPPHGKVARTWRYAPGNGNGSGDGDGGAVRLAGGAEMGRFNVGSTVIVLLPPGCVRWRADLEAGSAVRVGETLGDLVSGARYQSAAES